MILIIPKFPQRFRIRVYCLICVKHKRKPGYWFLCIAHILCALRLWNFQFVRCMLCYRCYTLVCIFHSDFFKPVFWLIVEMLCFVARRAILKLECLKRLVTFLISGLWYVKATHFLWSWTVGVSGSCCCWFCFLASSFFFRLCMMWVGNPLLLAIVSMAFHSCCWDCLVIITFCLCSG